MQKLSFLEVGLWFISFFKQKQTLISYDTEAIMVYGVLLLGTFELLVINCECHPCTSSISHAKGIGSVSLQDQRS